VIPSQRTVTRTIAGSSYNDLNKNGSFDSGEATSSLLLGGQLSATGTKNGVINQLQWAGNYTLRTFDGGLAAEVRFCLNLDRDLRLDVVDANTIATSSSMIIEGRAITKVRVIGNDGLTITTDQGNQHLIGGPGNDTLDATKGSDVLEGRGGNDKLVGGDGLDMAVFSGRSSLSSVSDMGSFLSISGDDGIDTLYGIEILRFSDGDFAYSTELKRLVSLPARPLMSFEPTPNLQDATVRNDQKCSTSYPLSWVMPSQRTLTRKISGYAYDDLNGNLSFDSGEASSSLIVGNKLSGAGSVNGVINQLQWTGDYTFRMFDGGLAAEVRFCLNHDQDLRLDVIDANTIGTSNSMIIEGRAISKVRVIGNQGLTITTDWGNQHLIGGPGNDTLDATKGSDILEGRGGNDKLVGGDGLDMAVFSGRSGLYSVSDIGSYLTVSGGNDGSDALYGVEVLRFTDGDFVFSPDVGRLVRIK
jgi:Ca2+-binding RTX toxin-like protein